MTHGPHPVQVPIFKFCDTRCIIDIVQKMCTTVYLPREFIVREGQIGRAIFLINRGNVEVVAQEPKGNAQTRIALLADNDFFGESALMSRGHDGVAVATVQGR